jgi:hypothetical protein
LVPVGGWLLVFVVVDKGLLVMGLLVVLLVVLSVL